MAEQVSWPGWEVGRCIGQGGFGAVYEISRDVFGDVEKKALKVITIPKDPGEVDFMRIEGMDDVSITASFHDKVAEIAGEYKLMGKIQGCPNIVHCDDFRYVRHENGIGWDIFIRMELLTPLTKAMDRVQTEQQIIQLGKDMCSALIACQQQNIIHRDIKPQNIFVAPEGHFKLGDFGISRTMEHTTQATGGIGTYSYMAPEVFRRKKYGPQVDIYSLGLVLYWLLNERRSPFVPLPPEPSTALANEEGRRRRFDGEPIPAPKHGSEALKKVVLKACAYRPEERYRNAGEMRDALIEVERGNAETKQDTVYGPRYQSESVLTTEYVDDKTQCLASLVEKTKSANTSKERTVSGRKKLPIILGVLAAVIAIAVAVVGFVMPIQEDTEPTQIVTEDKRRVLRSDFWDVLPEKSQFKTITFSKALAEAPEESIDVSVQQDSSVVAWYEKTDGSFYDLYIAADGSVIAPENCYNLFGSASNVKSIIFGDSFDTSNVTNMSGMFYFCTNLTSLYLNDFDTSNVTDMSNMFSNCQGLTSLRVSDFDTSKVTDMSGMFDWCRNLTSLDIANWNTSSVTDMSYMFNFCKNLGSMTLNNWDTSNVTDMSNMFSSCQNMISLNISTLDTSSVRKMAYMFYGCYNLGHLEVENFDTSNVTDMSYMFANCWVRDELNLDSFDFSKVELFDGFLDSNQKINGRPWEEYFHNRT